MKHQGKGCKNKYFDLDSLFNFINLNKESL